MPIKVPEVLRTRKSAMSMQTHDTHMQFEAPLSRCVRISCATLYLIASGSVLLLTLVLVSSVRNPAGTPSATSTSSLSSTPQSHAHPAMQRVERVQRGEREHFIAGRAKRQRAKRSLSSAQKPDALAAQVVSIANVAKTTHHKRRGMEPAAISTDVAPTNVALFEKDLGAAPHQPIRPNAAPHARSLQMSSASGEQPSSKVAILVGRWGVWPAGLAVLMLRTMAQNQALDFHIISDALDQLPRLPYDFGPTGGNSSLPANVYLHYLSLPQLVRQMQRTIGLRLNSVRASDVT